VQVDDGGHFVTAPYRNAALRLYAKLSADYRLDRSHATFRPIGRNEKPPAGVSPLCFVNDVMEMTMPPRNPQLPEGTDQIVSGAANDGAGSSGGFVAKSDAASEGDATDRLVTTMRDQVSGLRGQAGEKLRGLADGGKDRATGLLDNFSEVIADAARSIDERLGADYGGYAHRAAGAVSSFSDTVRGKTVDELLDDGKEIVRKSPAVAIAAAAVVGFALFRLVRTGLDETTGRSARGSGATRPKRDEA